MGLFKRNKGGGLHKDWSAPEAARIPGDDIELATEDRTKRRLSAFDSWASYDPRGAVSHTHDVMTNYGKGNRPGTAFGMFPEPPAPGKFDL